MFLLNVVTCVLFSIIIIILQFLLLNVILLNIVLLFYYLDLIKHFFLVNVNFLDIFMLLTFLPSVNVRIFLTFRKCNSNIFQSEKHSSDNNIRLKSVFIGKVASNNPLRMNLISVNTFDPIIDFLFKEFVQQCQGQLPVSDNFVIAKFYWNYLGPSKITDQI